MPTQRDPDFYPTLGWMVVTLALIFSGTEMAPGWEILGLHWPPTVYYLIMALAGAFAGACSMPGYALPGLLAGPVGGVGALAAVAWYLGRVNQTVDVAVIIAGAIGAIPGFGLFWLLKLGQDFVAPPIERPEYEPVESDSQGHFVENEEAV